MLSLQIWTSCWPIKHCFCWLCLIPRDLIRHVDECVCVEKQWEVGGNGLCVHLVWPLCSLIDQLYNNKQKFLNKVPISCCAMSWSFLPIDFSLSGRLTESRVFLTRIVGLLDDATQLSVSKSGLHQTVKEWWWQICEDTFELEGQRVYIH